MMLLRRITEHVKAQNWFAVVLDFVIVVIGVFIGIQVANWNETRAEKAQEQRIIKRLHEDYEALSAELDQDIAFLSSLAGLLDDFRDIIVSEPQQGDVERLREFYETAFSLPAVTGQSDTYEQLIASGDMSLITNNQLRTKIVAHAKLTESLQHRDKAVREWSRPYLESIVRLSHLLEALPVRDALTDAGSKADLIVAARMYHDVFTQQLETNREHRKSFTSIIELLAKEKQ